MPDITRTTSAMRAGRLTGSMSVTIADLSRLWDLAYIGARHNDCPLEGDNELLERIGDRLVSHGNKPTNNIFKF
jgi:hypothetical protein